MLIFLTKSTFQILEKLTVAQLFVSSEFCSYRIYCRIQNKRSVVSLLSLTPYSLRLYTPHAHT
jgi:hypothetical protein